MKQKFRRHILDSNAHLGISNGVFPTLEEAIPEGYEVATYGYDTLVIIPKGHNFATDRYGEIGYIYTGQAA